MKSKLKKIAIPLILMIILDLSAFYYIGGAENFGAGLNAYIGLFFVCGLLLGPYGAAGATIGNMLCDVIRGYSLSAILLSAIISFGSSYLSYVLWYEPFRKNSKIIKPRIINTHYLIKFLVILLFTGLVYSILIKLLFIINYPRLSQNSYIFYRYFLNYINFGFLFGITGIWISRKINITHQPKLSKKQVNKKIYLAISILLIISIATTTILNYYYQITNETILITETAAILLLLYLYLTKPMTSEIHSVDFKSILEKITDTFLGVTIIIVILAMIISNDIHWGNLLTRYLPIPNEDIFVLMFFFSDLLSLFYFIPSFIIFKYIEKNVITPITSFSKIKNFIKKDEKIENDGLIKLYSEYVDEDNEIGMMARSYTELCEHNNQYIENIHKIEREKERIKAELDIAEKIQQANLPTEGIEQGDISVRGFSKPAKEVGGDFYDYYQIDDENLAIVIGDASGKGVPAALLSTITQAIIKQILKTEKDPSRVLYSLNNQLCENNTEVMFITLWLGIYNKKTHKLIFSNAGHNPPAIYHNKEFEFLNRDNGIVLGILKNFEFTKEETTISKGMLLYTDGITDANNANDELYGEDRLIDFLNKVDFDERIISKLLNDINKFSENEEQFDDMTLLVLEKHD